MNVLKQPITTPLMDAWVAAAVGAVCLAMAAMIPSPLRWWFVPAAAVNLINARRMFAAIRAKSQGQSTSAP